MSLPTGEPGKPVRGQSRVRSGADVLPDARAGPTQRVRVPVADVRVRPTSDPAVLGRSRAHARPPPAVDQEHGRAGGRDPRGPFGERGRGQRAAVPARRHAGRRHQGAAGPTLLLLRVQSPDRFAQTAGPGGPGPGVSGTGQADALAFRYDVISCTIILYYIFYCFKGARVFVGI